MPDDQMAGWMVEKLGIVLGDLARIADIAKDPETPEWYRSRLRHQLISAFGNGLKVLFYALDRLDDWKPELAQQPADHGTLGLAAQLGSMGIAHQLNVGEPLDDLDDLDDEEDDEADHVRLPAKADQMPSPSEEPWGSFARQRIMTLTFVRLMEKDMAVAEKTALAWIAYHLTTSEYPDVAFLTRNFFARDIGVSEEEGEAVLAALIEKKLIHRETRLDDERRMAIRLVIEGMNDPRHEPQAN